MSITKALNAAVKEYRFAHGGIAQPVITMPRCMLSAIALAIEKELGDHLFELSPHRGFMYNGIRFQPSEQQQDEVPHASEA
jgi:hypothetical protein